MQNAGTTLTLSGQALNGISINAGTVSLAGDLVLDLSDVSLYNGLMFTLANASSLSGVWSNVEVSGSYDECSQVNVSVDYTQSSAVATLSVVNICNEAANLIASFWLYVQ
jgi:hypothetical protein